MDHPENLNKQITISRVISAPVEKVFQAWLEPEILVKWYNAGDGWTTPYAEIDACAGGKFKIGFQSPDRKNDFAFVGIYNELIPNEKIVFTIGDGRPVTVILNDQGGETKVDLTLTLETHFSQEHQTKGWSAMLKNLETLFK